MSQVTSTESIGLRVQQELRATPEEVFDALTDPEAQRSWLSPLGPDDGAVETSVDLRVGGSWKARFRPNPETEVDDVHTFAEIDRPHRLVTDLVSESMIGGQRMPVLESRIVMTFEPEAAGTLVTVEQTGFRATEMRDFFANVAWPSGLARLEAFLA
ncbi:MAG: SRPBCC domain-containing protein [Mycetocola sp.]